MRKCTHSELFYSVSLILCSWNVFSWCPVHSFILSHFFWSVQIEYNKHESVARPLHILGGCVQRMHMYSFSRMLTDPIKRFQNHEQIFGRIKGVAHDNNTTTIITTDINNNNNRRTNRWRVCGQKRMGSIVQWMEKCICERISVTWNSMNIKKKFTKKCSSVCRERGKKTYQQRDDNEKCVWDIGNLVYKRSKVHHVSNFEQIPVVFHVCHSLFFTLLLYQITNLYPFVLLKIFFSSFVQSFDVFFATFFFSVYVCMSMNVFVSS